MKVPVYCESCGKIVIGVQEMVEDVPGRPEYGNCYGELEPNDDYGGIGNEGDLLCITCFQIQKDDDSIVSTY